MKLETLHTSGSTGKPKEIVVEKSRMMASARMTCDFLGLKQGDTALLCLSTNYIAGRMMEIRAEERGLRLIRREPSSHPLKDVTEHINFAAMVPMQVYESLKVPMERERLARIDNLIIGGGAIDAELEKELRTFPNRIFSTYGMTETLSHIALRPVSGPDASLWYTPLPGVSISVDERGCLVINAPLLNPNTLYTNDIAKISRFSVKGSDPLTEKLVETFKVIGRIDNVICSGGIKIQIEEVETALRQYFDFEIMVTSRPNKKFGEVVVYLTTLPIDEHALRLAVPPYWLPKQIIQISQLPKTETGKPDRAKAKLLAQPQP